MRVHVCFCLFVHACVYTCEYVHAYLICKVLLSKCALTFSFYIFSSKWYTGAVHVRLLAVANSL